MWLSAIGEAIVGVRDGELEARSGRPVPVLAMSSRIYAAATFPPLGPERVARRGKRREARVEWSPLPSSLRPDRVEWANRSGATMRPLCLEHLGGTRAPTVGRDGRPVGSSRLRAPVQGLASIAAAWS